MSVREFLASCSLFDWAMPFILFDAFVICAVLALLLAGLKRKGPNPMIVSERNLKQTCEFLVNEYRFGRSTYEEARQSFRGLSLLLVGHVDKKHIQCALDNIDAIKHTKAKKAVNHG